MMRRPRVGLGWTVAISAMVAVSCSSIRIPIPFGTSHSTTHPTIVKVATKVAPDPEPAKSTDISMKCEAYGHLIECRARNAGTNPVIFAEIEGAKPPYVAAGDSISFMTYGKALYMVELHLPYADNFPVLRTWARWGKDQTDGVMKMLFSAYPPGNESE